MINSSTGTIWHIEKFAKTIFSLIILILSANECYKSLLTEKSKHPVNN